MTVHLPADVEASIRQQVESGRFGDEAGVVREAMRLLDEHERRRWLKHALAVGEQGEAVDFTPELLAQLGHEAEENARNGKPLKDAVKP
ncbi:MAG: type II toxin-antitoxin system ParD family antitoxin [Thermomicrobiales bacterium]